MHNLDIWAGTSFDIAKIMIVYKSCGEYNIWPKQLKVYETKLHIYNKNIVASFKNLKSCGDLFILVSKVTMHNLHLWVGTEL